ncbi:hypothetical protein D1007_27363 [Hordeum vulgare]|nr:hypothetical protein D1007_27363 [Hordeum vulgare]
MRATPMSSVPPASSTALITAPPIGSNVVTTVPTTPPLVSLVTTAAIPTPSTLAYSMQHVPEDQTGVAKEAMIQAELMMQQTREAYEASKLAYDAGSVLQANIQKACEIGSKYANLELEKNQLQLDLEVKANDFDALKKTLEDRDKVLAEVKERSEAAEKKRLDISKLEEEITKLKKEQLKWGKSLIKWQKGGMPWKSSSRTS